jgi:hypothetical protein
MIKKLRNGNRNNGRLSGNKEYGGKFLTWIMLMGLIG